MLLLYIDVKPVSLKLSKTPWFSGGFHICFHFPPSGCCKNTFQGMHVPGACFHYLAEYSSSQYSFKCAREGPALMHYSETSVIIWFRGALLCMASLGFEHEDIARCSALQSCGLCMWASSWSLEPPQSEIRPNSVLLAALIPAGQSRTPDSTLRLCYQAIRVQPCSPFS